MASDSLLELWQQNPESIRRKELRQLIQFAGEGHLHERSKTSLQFRELLNALPSDELQRRATECLEKKLKDSGLALQDIVNEFGRRLDLTVTNGRYKGGHGLNGFDGLWLTSSGHLLVVEVKTTTAFQIDLEISANYRRDLIRDGQTTRDTSSVLIVVGRRDIGGLEEQVRGSRFAWNMRIISVEALMRFVRVKEALDDPSATRRIHDLLIPREYTRLDEIIDLIFTSTGDVSEIVETDTEIETAESANGNSTSVDHPKFAPLAFNHRCADRAAGYLKCQFLKRSRSYYSTTDKATGIVVLVSRLYEDNGPTRYSYAFLPHQKKILEDVPRAYVVFGCGSQERTLMIPYQSFAGWLPGLNTTTRKDGTIYWHIHIHELGGRLTLVRKGGLDKIPLDEYLLKN